MSSYKRWKKASDVGAKVFKWTAGARLKGEILGWKEGQHSINIDGAQVKQRLVEIADETLGLITFPTPTQLYRDLFVKLNVAVGETVDILCLGTQKGKKGGNDFLGFETQVLRDDDESDPWAAEVAATDDGVPS